MSESGTEPELKLLEYHGTDKVAVVPKKGGRPKKVTVQQVKDALTLTRNNITKSAAALGCSRQTIERMFHEHEAELEAHYDQVQRAIGDSMKETVVVAGQTKPSVAITWLKNYDEEWQPKPTQVEAKVQHQIVDGQFSQEQIHSLSGDDLSRFIKVREAELKNVELELTRLEAETGNPESGTGDSEATE